MSSNSYGESPGERATKVTNTVTVHSYTPRIGGFFFGGSFPEAYLYQKDGSMNDCDDKTKEPQTKSENLTTS
jgi:hypothetical protein